MSGMRFVAINSQTDSATSSSEIAIYSVSKMFQVL